MALRFALSNNGSAAVTSQSLNLVLDSFDIRESVLTTYGEFVLKSLSSLSRNKSSVFLLVLALIVGGVGAQATGLLNTPSGGYLVCVNSTTKVITYPGTSSCPKGSEKLVLGAQGAQGATGATVATGVAAPVVTGDNCIGTKCTYKVGDTGPGGV
jgi:hypothetical protein